MIIYDSTIGNLMLAKAYIEAGFNILPVRCDGTKRPKIAFERYNTEPFPWWQASKHFASKGNPSGIGILCGSTSGNLEGLDFDLQSYIIFPEWCREVSKLLPGLLKTLPIVRTPDDGRHVYYRCQTIESGHVLAASEEKGVLIETRGQGNYIIAPGSPPSTHPTGRQYRLIHGDLLYVPTISPDQREILLDVARGFNRYVKPTRSIKESVRTVGQAEFGDVIQRPGDDFNSSTDWETLLKRYGWLVVRTRGDVTYWGKPGSDGKEHHATSNYGGTDTLHIFSTAIPGFESGSYSKFAVFAIVEHDGDFTAAARELATNGYGQLLDFESYFSTLEA